MARPRPARAAIAALLAACTATSPGTARPQGPHWPGPAEMEQARRQHPFPGLAGFPATPLPAPPAFPSAEPATPLDLEALARRGAALGRETDRTQAGAPALHIFVSLSVPQASLERLATQAARTGARLVLRGLHEGSMQRTLAAVQPWLGGHRVALQIDPEAFTRFGISAVPAFVLTAGDAQTESAGCAGQCRTTTFAAATGDVSTAYALAFIARQRPALAPQAEALLERLR